MKPEIDKAVETFHRIAFGTGKKGQQLISDTQLVSFVAVLTELLIARYRNYWYPMHPNRGSGYRCLRVNSQSIDPTIEKSMKKSGIRLTDSMRALELTIWVDPGVVSLRIGEEGSIGTDLVEPSTVPEDEAYVSRSPSPVEDSDNYTHSKDRTVQVPTPAQSIRPLPPTPTSMPRSGVTDQGRPMAPPLPNSPEDFLRNIPQAPQQQQAYSRPRALFNPTSQDVASFSGYPVYRDIGMGHPGHQMSRGSAPMPMPMNMYYNYMDIPAQA